VQNHNTFPEEEHCLSFLGLVKPQSAYQDTELKVPIVAEMTMGIIEGNHCIAYKESKPNDMGSLIKDIKMKGMTTLCDNISASSSVYVTSHLLIKIYVPTTIRWKAGQQV